MRASGEHGIVLARKGSVLSMEGAALSPLVQWENFYVIVGSSAGALTGLQFVVIALIAEAQAARSMLEIRAFGTPTVVHFCALLLISAVLNAPWPSLSGAAISLGISGVAGVVYVITVIRHARRQTGYTPETTDWMWYIVLPLAGYASLAIAAIPLTGHPTASLFVIAGTALLLLFIGIHNAWDTVTLYCRCASARVGRERLIFLSPKSLCGSGLRFGRFFFPIPGRRAGL